MRYNRPGFISCALAAILFSGCTSDENKVHYENKLFISATDFVQEMRVSEDVTALSHEITLGIAKPEAVDITAALAEAPGLLDHFREAYYEPEAILLPAGHVDLSNSAMTVDAGKVVSKPLRVEFTGLDGLDMEKTYVLPVTLSGANLALLDGAQTFYYLFKKASLVNVVADILGRKKGDSDQVKDNKLWPGPGDWNDPTPVKDMSAFTLEALVNIHSFDNDEIATLMGIEDRFLIRFGDAGIPKNQLQVAWGKMVEGSVERGNITDASMKLNPGRWYHIAVTFDGGAIAVYIDGQRKATGNSAGLTSIDFGVPHLDPEVWGEPRSFWIGYSYADGRCLNGMISEVRIWNRALTSGEIQAPNHFYKVAPDSEGLAAYWKFDEGAGDIVKDYTRWGNNLTSALPLKWFPVALPIEE